MQLLSGNRNFPSCFPYRDSTGVTYTYLAPAASKIFDPYTGAVTKNTILLNGRSFKGYNTDNEAYYSADSVDIVFDLKAVHEISALTVIRDGTNALPISLTVSVSMNGSNYKMVSNQTFNPAASKIETPVFSEQGRYVRLKLKWTASGGRLAQVEIWGTSNKTIVHDAVPNPIDVTGVPLNMDPIIVFDNFRVVYQNLLTGIQDTLLTSRAFTYNGKIYVENSTGAVTIYNIIGQTVKIASADEALFGIKVPLGVYLVKTNSKVSKIIVK